MQILDIYNDHIYSTFRGISTTFILNPLLKAGATYALVRHIYGFFNLAEDSKSGLPSST